MCTPLLTRFPSRVMRASDAESLAQWWLCAENREGEAMLVEILVAPGCAARQSTLELVRRVLDELAPEARLEVITVDTAEQAAELKFPGSPTVRINGRDIEPEADKSFHFGLG